LNSAPRESHLVQTPQQLHEIDDRRDSSLDVIALAG
jgi:hypothetical protein